MNPDDFKKNVSEKTLAFLSSIPEKHHIKHISHLDADGLSSAAIVVAALAERDLTFTTTIVPTLDHDTFPKVVHENYTHYIITDLGSSHLSMLKEVLADKPILIIDHHEIEDVEIPESWTHINPRTYGVDGNAEISGSGAAYYALSSSVKNPKRFAHVALIGATGDVQASPDFVGANDEIQQDAVEYKSLVVKQMLNFYGISTKPLPYLLEWSNDIIIPNVNRKRGAGITFLNNIGIHTEIGGRPTLLEDLSPVEQKRLTIALGQATSKSEDELNTPHHILCRESVGRSTRTLKEYSTLLNACGRMKKFGVGIGACLNDGAVKELAFVVEGAYKKKIGEALRWYKQTKHESGEKYVLIQGTSVVADTMIGTVASIAARQNDIAPGTYIIAIADKSDGNVKLSLRISGETGEENLQHVAHQLTEGCNAQTGGHNSAAGAVFSKEFEPTFLENVRKHLRSQAQEVAASSSDVL